MSILKPCMLLGGLRGCCGAATCRLHGIQDLQLAEDLPTAICQQQSDYEKDRAQRAWLCCPVLAADQAPRRHATSPSPAAAAAACVCAASYEQCQQECLTTADCVAWMWGVDDDWDCIIDDTCPNLVRRSCEETSTACQAGVVPEVFSHPGCPVFTWEPFLASLVPGPGRLPQGTLAATLPHPAVYPTASLTAPLPCLLSLRCSHLRAASAATACCSLASLVSGNGRRALKAATHVSRLLAGQREVHMPLALLPAHVACATWHRWLASGHNQQLCWGSEWTNPTIQAEWTNITQHTPAQPSPRPAPCLQPTRWESSPAGPILDSSSPTPCLTWS